jgi:hypothetical protein
MDEPKEVESREVRNAWIREEVKVAQFNLSLPIELIFMDCQTFQKHSSILTRVGNWWRWRFGTMNKWENDLHLDLNHGLSFHSKDRSQTRWFIYKSSISEKYGFKIHPSSSLHPKVVFHASMNLHIQLSPFKHKKRRKTCGHTPLNKFLV